MVGLVELGEFAWQVEKLINRLLEEQRAVTPAVLAMIEVAGTSFRQWVDALREFQRVTPDPQALHEAIRAVEAELPGQDSVLPAAAVESRARLQVVLPQDRAQVAANEHEHASDEPAAALEAQVADADPAQDHEFGHQDALPQATDEEAAHAALPTVEVEELSAHAFTAHEYAELGEPGAPGAVVEIVDQAEAEEELEASAPDVDASAPKLPSGLGIEVEALLPVDPLPHAPTLKLVADNTHLRVLTPPIAPPVFVVAPPESDGDIPVAGPDVDIPAALPDIDIDIDIDLAAADQAATASAAPRADDDLAPADLVPANLASDASDDTTVGGVTLSTSLWRILVEEAAQHLATLDYEFGVLQFDSHAVPSPAMIRAAHTLCGIHRTGGFEPVAGFAKALELALTALAQRDAPLPAATLPVVATAVALLREVCADVSACRSSPQRLLDEVRGAQVELDALRQLGSVDDDLDAETHAADVAARDDGPAAGAEAPAQGVDAPEASPPAADEVGADGVLAASEPATDPLEGVRDELEDSQVLEIFLEEAAELFPAAGEQLRAWRRVPQDDGAAQHLRRTLHTFKGSARMAGAMRLGQLTHVMESRLLDGDRLALASPALFEALDTDLDRIALLLEGLRAGDINVQLPLAPDDVTDAVAPVPERTTPSPAAAAPPLGEPVAPPPAESPAPVEAAAVVPEPAAVAVPPAPAAPAVAEADAGTRAMLRVRADIVDRLVNEAGEVAIARARIESELRALKANLLELTGSVIRLRTQVREVEIQAETQIHSAVSQMQEKHEGFDPLEFDRFTRFQELTRSLAEGVNDVSTVQQQLLRNLDDADAALLAQARLSRDIQQQLFAIRTVPFASLSERLYRIVRGVARELGKRANLEIVGGQTELDRSVLEKLAGPLEHLLRNALDHGVEAREARVAVGKPETGEITLTVRQSGNEVAIELADDGQGIDTGRVLEKARSLKLVPEGAAPTQAQLLQLIFQPGFSTAGRVTAISGRGVGMDVVRTEMGTLGGRVDVATEAGRGTRFTLALPLTLAVAQAVLVRAAGRLWALPAPMVEQVQQVREDALLALYEAHSVAWQGRSYPFHYLPRLLGDTAHQPETKRYNSVLLVRSGQGVAAVHVDEMVGNQEIVVKNVGEQLARVAGISGATVLGTGEIVLILNPVQLAQRTDVTAFDPNAEARVRIGSTSAANAAPPLVLVVDDSLTVRKITSRLLAREGFRVATARDGLDALQAVGDETPDIILLDIEMPRMDGFEFTKTLKRDPRHAHVPIIMITSRTADKHRARAAELGVDLYLGKPFQEEDLLRNLREMLGLQEATA